MNLLKFRAWHFRIFRLYSVAHAIPFPMIVKAINANLLNPMGTESIRKFIKKLETEGYLEKSIVKGDTIYAKTEKLNELEKEAIGYLSR